MAMRFLIRATIGLEQANRQFRDEGFSKKMFEALEFIDAEAVYFGVENGARCIFLIVTLNGSEDIPKIAEPLWLVCEATVDFVPLISFEDMDKARPHFQKIRELDKM